MNNKRKDYISWDEYFMGVAKLSSYRSKDPSTQVGACIVSDNKKIIGMGYNGFPRGIDDDVFPWGNEGEYINTKYPYVVHAEVNAILNAIDKLDGATLFVTLFPCNECAKLVIQSGIKEIVFLSDESSGRHHFDASYKLFEAANIKLRRMKDFTLKYESIL
jgi:dCMP deaminase